MTTRKTPPPFLRLVDTPPVVQAVEQRDFQIAAWQDSLFSTTLPNLLLFIRFDVVSESDFLSSILSARPRYIFDLRLAPRFDLGTLNRKLVFSVFRQVGAQYYDMAARLGIQSVRDAKLNPALLVDELKMIAGKSKQSIEGPIAFLIGGVQAEDAYEMSLLRHLESVSHMGWEAFRVPRTPKQAHTDAARDLVFISHANPEDNEFARWLGASLCVLGYKVWSDVTRLIGGEEFWDDIEEAIRFRSIKVVVCLSRLAQGKNGVLDEVNCAVATERSQGLENFVIPIRLDDLPFSDVRANIGRKNIIDFSANWGAGLRELVRTFNRDGVPRPIEQGAHAVAMLARTQRRSTAQIEEGQDQLFANWFKVKSLPETLRFIEFSGSLREPEDLRKAVSFPTISYLRLVAGFASVDEFQQQIGSKSQITLREEFSTAEYLRGAVARKLGATHRDARNHISSLVRQAWNYRASSCGLLPWSTAAKTVAWYAPHQLFDDDVIQFVGPEGRRIRKNLVGRSERRKVFWHFATEAVVSVHEPMHIVLRPHVLFSEDGRTPLTSVPRMHALRRGFCKTWWNDRWRDLTAAFAASMAEGTSEILLSVSNTQSIRIDATMMAFSAPVRVKSVADPTSSDDDSQDWVEDPEIDEAEVVVYDSAVDDADG